MSDSLMRQFEMLRFLPRAPKRATTLAIRAHLESLGYAVTLRTVQRDLIALSSHFPLVADERDQTHGWAWSQDAVESLLGMDSITALSLVMALQLLDKALPPSVLHHLRYLRSEAEKVLARQDASTFQQWPDKVRVLSRGQPLLPARVVPSVLEAVYGALLLGRRLACVYEGRNGEPTDMVVSPLGIVLRQSVVYLIATVWEYKDIRQMALHRFKTAELTETPVTPPPDFSLDRYLTEGAMGVKSSDDPLPLHFKVSPPAGQHLLETPLSANQEVTVMDDGWLEVYVTVPDTWELRWWLLGFGDQLEVLGPNWLRQEIGKVAMDMAARYR